MCRSKSLSNFAPHVSDSDQAWMEVALTFAQRALEENEIPIGAVLVLNGMQIGAGWNRTLTQSDPTAHAEIVAIREAAEALGTPRLLNSTLFVTLEPCAMCLQAIQQARITRLVYGATNHAPSPRGVPLSITANLLQARCSTLLKDFFTPRRKK